MFNAPSVGRPNPQNAADEKARRQKEGSERRAARSDAGPQLLRWLWGIGVPAAAVTLACVWTSQPPAKVATLLGLALDIGGALMLTAGALWNERTIRQVGTYEWLEGHSYRHRLRVDRVLGWWAFGAIAAGFAFQAIGSLLA